MDPRISVSEFALVLRGWAKPRRLRVVLRTPLVTFGVFGSLYAATEEIFSIEVGESSIIGISVAGCVFAFEYSLPEGEPVLGKRVESGLVAVRENFNLAIMLLHED